SITRCPAASTLFPYTTLFRSGLRARRGGRNSLGPERASVDEGLGRVRPEGQASAPGPGGAGERDLPSPGRRCGHRHRELALLFADRKSTRLNSSHVSISYAVF